MIPIDCPTRTQYNARIDEIELQILSIDRRIADGLSQLDSLQKEQKDAHYDLSARNAILDQEVEVFTTHVLQNGAVGLRPEEQNLVIRCGNPYMAIRLKRARVAAEKKVGLADYTAYMSGSRVQVEIVKVAISAAYAEKFACLSEKLRLLRQLVFDVAHTTEGGSGDREE